MLVSSAQKRNGLWLALVVWGMWVSWPHAAFSRTDRRLAHPRVAVQAVEHVVAEPQKVASDESAMFKVSLASTQPCAEALSGQCFLFQVVDKRMHRAVTFRLANETAQVESVRIVNRSQLAIVGWPQPNLAIVTLVSLPLGKEIDRVVCSKSSLSPSKRFIAYLKFAPAHPGYNWSPSAEYIVYDLAASPRRNRTPLNRSRALEPYDAGWPFFPLDATNGPGDNMLEGHNVPAHWLISPFVWIGKSDTVVFVDRWRGSNSLIVGQFGGAARLPSTTVYPLDITGLVDLSQCRDGAAPSDFDGWSKDPATLIDVRAIEELPDNRSVLRLHLLPHPCLRSDMLDMHIGLRLSE